jgi:hypothetical protein
MLGNDPQTGDSIFASPLAESISQIEPGEVDSFFKQCQRRITSARRSVRNASFDRQIDSCLVPISPSPKTIETGILDVADTLNTHEKNTPTSLLAAEILIGMQV